MVIMVFDFYTYRYKLQVKVQIKFVHLFRLNFELLPELLQSSAKNEINIPFEVTQE